MRMHMDLEEASVQLVGGPTTIIESGGLRFVTDPTFDPPTTYDVGGRTLTKTTSPSVNPESIGAVDAVLLSHHQHVDNLDTKGRDWMTGVQTIFTTTEAADRIPGVVALPNWNSVNITRPNGEVLKVTGVPAQHGPDNTQHLVGEVTGFVISGEGLQTIYVSGDNASLSVVRTIADRFPSVDVAILFCGAAQTPLLENRNLTLGSEDAAKAAQILQARRVIPVHYEGWAHYTEGTESIRFAFEKMGIENCLHLLKPGERVNLFHEIPR
ncbi:MBL fold metallo-hydrolase [Alicyclobacillus sp. SO9]|uniref:MBL fold metallo-hydrolase n=1 Tax=Alicyclobacillus sp. SO9 TaxID=2665646 RepID=UPI0018E83393|nr:MBL fold metallo-hydrolase [Alicyclobacillus sp. SO9]QQE78344.1 MBL fold metallo-hydrolase [Alicyclobacillus sp. SO9]